MYNPIFIFYFPRCIRWDPLTANEAAVSNATPLVFNYTLQFHDYETGRTRRTPFAYPKREYFAWSSRFSGMGFSAPVIHCISYSIPTTH
jgi:hypothetical protein